MAKASGSSFMSMIKPNWKLPEGYLEMAKASEKRIAKRYKVKNGKI